MSSSSERNFSQQWDIIRRLFPSLTQIPDKIDHSKIQMSPPITWLKPGFLNMILLKGLDSAFKDV
jgi:hypothetical protein